MTLLEVSGLQIGVKGSPAALLRDVSFSVEPGKILGLVGESGSGKTMTSLALMGLLPDVMELRAGSIRVEGREIVDPRTRSVQRAPAEMAMVFQQPRSALNPTMRVGKQIARVLRIRAGLSGKEAGQQAIEMLSKVGIPGAARVARAYPHQLSGGMCQRVMIAMALACRPRLLVADEPTTALDVTIQAQIFDLIEELVAETGCGVVLITHDLAAVAEMCDDVAVLYGGQVMELVPKAELLTTPRHPYSRFLLEAVSTKADPRAEDKGVDFGLVGCRFSHRCQHAVARCNEFPPLTAIGTGHWVSCVRADEKERYVPA